MKKERASSTKKDKFETNKKVGIVLGLFFQNIQGLTKWDETRGNTIASTTITIKVVTQSQ